MRASPGAPPPGPGPSRATTGRGGAVAVLAERTDRRHHPDRGADQCTQRQTGQPPDPAAAPGRSVPHPESRLNTATVTDPLVPTAASTSRYTILTGHRQDQRQARPAGRRRLPRSPRGGARTAPGPGVRTAQSRRPAALRTGPTQRLRHPAAVTTNGCPGGPTAWSGRDGAGAATAPHRTNATSTTAQACWSRVPAATSKDVIGARERHVGSVG